MEASYDTRPIVAQSGVEDFCKTANQNVEDEITDKEDFVWIRANVDELHSFIFVKPYIGQGHDRSGVNPENTGCKMGIHHGWDTIIERQLSEANPATGLFLESGRKPMQTQGENVKLCTSNLTLDQ